jgi:hypothetical protein
VGLQALGEAGIAGLVEFYSKESQIVLPWLLGRGRRFDMAIVDGNHRFDTVLPGRRVKGSMPEMRWAQLGSNQ